MCSSVQFFRPHTPSGEIATTHRVTLVLTPLGLPVLRIVNVSPVALETSLALPRAPPLEARAVRRLPPFPPLSFFSGAADFGASLWQAEAIERAPMPRITVRTRWAILIPSSEAEVADTGKQISVEVDTGKSAFE